MNDQSHRPPPAKKSKKKRKLHSQQQASNERLEEEILADLDMFHLYQPHYHSSRYLDSNDEGTTAPVTASQVNITHRATSTTSQATIATS